MCNPTGSMHQASGRISVSLFRNRSKLIAYRHQTLMPGLAPAAQTQAHVMRCIISGFGKNSYLKVFAILAV